MKVISLLCCCLPVFVACSQKAETPNVELGAGGSGDIGGAGGANAAVGGDVSGGGAGTSSAGVTGSDAASGAGGAANGGAGGAVGGEAGGMLALAGGGGNSNTQSGGSGGAVTASCAGSTHSLCLDFEAGKVQSPWTAPSSANAKVEEGNAAHGRYAMHLSNLHTRPQLFLHAAQLPGVKDVLWGRYYLYMNPGAPAGHGAMVRASDKQTNWYEVGFEDSAFMGDWHLLPGGVPERHELSKFMVPRKAWVCVEFQFDGATPEAASIWSDGTPLTFYDIATKPAIVKAGQFTSIDIGIVFYHGTSLDVRNGNDMPYITDAWLDDIALDTKRIGCL